MEAALNSIPAKDTAFTTNPSAISHAPSRVPSGHIRQVISSNSTRPFNKPAAVQQMHPTASVD
jgi:hypothetical protein